MADNVTLDPGSGGAVIRTDDDGTAHWQYVKVAYGADNTQTIVSTSNPLPIDLRTDNLSGNLDINIAASAATVTVSGSGTFTTQDTANQVDDAAFTPGTSRIVMIGAEYDDTTPDSVNEGDGGAIRMSANRNAYINIRDAAGNERGANVDASFRLSVSVDNSPTLGANSGVDIGDVDVTSVTPGTAAGNLGKAEDAAHATGDTGVMTLAVRRDADTSLVGADNDYAPLQVNATGALKVEIFDGGDSHTIDGTVTANAGTGTFTVTDDGAFTLAANSGVDIGDVDVTSIVPGTGATNLGKAEDAAHTSGDVGVMSLAVRRDANTTLVATDGDYAPLQVDANGALKVEIFDGGDSHTVDGTVTANAGTGAFEVDGAAAHDAAISGNPVPIAARANANEPTAVADADATYLWADTFGRLVILNAHPSPEAPDQTDVTASGDTTVIAAPGASVALHICKGSVHNAGASAITVQLRDGTAGTVRWEAELAADGGGSLFDFGSRGWKLTDNTALVVNLSGAGTVSCNVTEYYIAA